MANKKSHDFARSALRALAIEYKHLMEEPVEGFRVKLGPNDDLFNWEVAIFGPPNTIYQGGCFKAAMSFPTDYPYSPPTVTFLSKMWHPNVYENGEICISILHPPIDDVALAPDSSYDDSDYGELPCERWNPTQTVRTVLLSIISLLNEPNTFSPANVDASVSYRRWIDSRGADKEYENVVKRQVRASRILADAEGIKIPLTIEEYCHKTTMRNSSCVPAVATDVSENTDFLRAPSYDDDDDDNDFYLYGDDDDNDDDDDDDDNNENAEDAAALRNENKKIDENSVATEERQ